MVLTWVAARISRLYYHFTWYRSPTLSQFYSHPCLLKPAAFVLKVCVLLPQYPNSVRAGATRSCDRNKNSVNENEPRTSDKERIYSPNFTQQTDLTTPEVKACIVKQPFVSSDTVKNASWMQYCGCLHDLIKTGILHIAWLDCCSLWSWPYLGYGHQRKPPTWQDLIQKVEILPSL